MRNDELEAKGLMEHRVIAYKPDTKSVFYGTIVGGSKRNTKVKTNTGVTVSLKDDLDYAIEYDPEKYADMVAAVQQLNEAEQTLGMTLGGANNKLRNAEEGADGEA